MVQERKPLGQILQALKIVSAKQIKQALQQQLENPGKRLGQLLIDMGAATSEQVTEGLAKQFEMPFVDLKAVEIPPEIISSIPRNVAEEHGIVPVKRNGRVVTIAMSDPLDLFTLDNLRFILNTDVECVLATREDVQEAIEKYYGGTKDALGNVLEELTQSEITVRGVEAAQGGQEADDAPIIKLVTLIISEAVKTRASDIHIEPMEKQLRIRYRIDGVCNEVDSPPKRLQGSVLSRIKIMSDMDIAEKRKPQDGRIKIMISGRDLDLRVSALPATHGESIVMRILDKEASLVDLEELGLHPDDFKRFRGMIKRPNGIILVTGPTGSGKTTTLYAALKALNRSDVKIITAENPVEYVLAGINQSQVKAHIGMTFSRIIRAMLRQAPNIILVGEVRDLETAEIAIQAALTGHLVFSTLHTNDSSSAITRLIDMGIKPFLVASSIQAILAQRLLRILCPSCKQPGEISDPELMAVGLSRDAVEGRTIFHATGCEECRGKGYRGRKGIYEFLIMTASIREMAFNQEPTIKLRDAARADGMVTLLEDGVRKLISGMTTVEEVLSITHREDLSY